MKAYLVAGSPVKPSKSLFEQCLAQTDVLVAVDGGLTTCIDYGYTASFFFGDADSAGFDLMNKIDPLKTCMNLFPPHKDDTDLSLTLTWMQSLQVSEVILSGVTGGRLGHQLGVLGLLKRFASLKPSVVEDSCIYIVLSDKKGARRDIQLKDYANLGATVSVVPLTETACVSECGLTWEANDLKLELLSDRGISNVYEDESASVSISQGTCLVIINK